MCHSLDKRSQHNITNQSPTSPQGGGGEERRGNKQTTHHSTPFHCSPGQTITMLTKFSNSQNYLHISRSGSRLTDLQTSSSPSNSIPTHSSQRPSITEADYLDGNKTTRPSAPCRHRSLLSHPSTLVPTYLTKAKQFEETK